MMKGRIFKVFMLCLLLLVAKGETAAAKQTPTTVQSEHRFHTIQKGETLYGLTRLYQVKAEDICAANPGLSAENFKVGTVILIPAASAMEAEKKDTVEIEKEEPKGLAGSGCREMHEVKRKETLYSIAQNYGVTLEELLKANPETWKEGFKLKKKMVLCIPYHKEKKELKEEPTNEELFNRARKSTQGLKTIRVGVILPFKEKTAIAARTLDYYRGLLMAVDSLKRTGVSFEIYTFDAGKTKADLDEVLQRPIIPLLDIIFGPVDVTQIKAVSELSKKHKIPMIVPFSSKSDEVHSNPYFFVLNAPDSVQYQEVAMLFGSLFSKNNFLLIETGRPMEPVIPYLKKNFDSLRYAKLPISEKTLLSRLDPDKENVIMLTSADQKSLNILMPVLRNVIHSHPELKVKLFGYPEWQLYVSGLLEDYYAVDTYIFSPFYLNYSSHGYRLFSNEFYKNFHSEMLQVTPRVAIYGFDCGIYFLKGLEHYGRNFDKQNVYTRPLQNKFMMERETTWGGLTNHQMQLIHYTPSHQIEIIEKK